MHSITIHDVDPSLWELVKEKAKNDDQSLNKTIKGLLEQALGVKKVKNNNKRNEFKKFCGIWTDAETKEFNLAAKDFDTIDMSDWK